MKRTTLLIFATLLSTINIAFADNWLPFNPGQKSYYQIKNYYSEQILNKYMMQDDNRIIPFNYDSLTIRNNVKCYYSKEFIESYTNYKCLKSLYDSIYLKSETPEWFCNRMQPDSFSISNDTLMICDKYLYSELPTFKFNTLKIPFNLQVGDSFSQDLYTLFYDKIEYKTIFKNIADSIRTYRILYKKTKDGEIFEDYILELSKTYGLVRFSLWDNFLFRDIKLQTRQEFKLCGFELNFQKYGEVPSDYSSDSFFNQKVGDIKFWSYITRDDALNEVKEGFMKDSLKVINNINNKLIFNYDRTKLYDGKWTEYDVCEVYDKTELDDILNNSGRVLSFLKFPVVESFQQYIENPLNIELCGNYVSNPIWSKNINSWGYYIQHFVGWDFDSCKYVNQSNIENELMIFPGIGCTYSESKGDFGGSVQILLAYKSGDNLLGMIPEPLSVNQNVNSDLIIISPNPTFEKLTISQIPDGAVSYEIYDIFGNRVLSVETIHELSPQIDVSMFSPGIYFLKLNNKNPIKFVKI